ncbi:hypothetical protein BJX76DRAFT_358821 [Aspergillus varians]
MKFTFGTLITLAVAVAAMPARDEPPKESPKLSQTSVKKLDSFKNQCGDVNINCCINVPKDDHQKNFIGLGGLIDGLLSHESASYCSPAHGLGVIPIDLSNLLGFTDTHICDIPNVTYACCTSDTDCKEIGTSENGKKQKQ